MISKLIRTHRKDKRSHYESKALIATQEVLLQGAQQVRISVKNMCADYTVINNSIMYF